MNKCNDNLYVKPIEFCSKDALDYINKSYSDTKYPLDLYNIFNQNLIQNLPDLNNNFRQEGTNNFIFKYKGEGDRNKNLCGETNNIGEYYVNCVLQTNNPLFTFKDGYCSIPSEFNLPNELKKIEEKDNIFIKLNKKTLEDEEGNFKYQKIQNNKYCEDRWYDWIIIPNYHIGNRIFKDSGSYSKEDVKICYNNCGAGELPFINAGGSNLCIPKEYAYDGKYEKKLDYSPLSLINLIGNNKKHLNLLYKNLFFYKLNKKQNKYSIDTEVKLSNTLKEDNNYIINEVFDEIKEVLNNIVNDNNLDIPNYSLEYRYLTYKHPYFNETDLISLLGMDKNEILSNDIILIHTAYLAYNYYDFLNKIKEKDSFNDNDKLNITKNNDNDFNINKVLNDLDINSFLENYPNVNIKILESLKTNYIDNDKTSKKRQRLANILYKAINICYDNKSEFSINLINRTKTAFSNYQSNIANINKLNKDYNHIEFTDNNDYSKIILSSNINIIYNGFNIEYYKSNVLDEFHKNINTLFATTDDNFKNNYKNNFIFYTEERSEIISNNKCEIGQFLKDKTCVKCEIECNDNEKCKNDNNCKIYCVNNCKKFITNPDKTKCGGVENTDEEKNKNKKPLKEITNEIKTPIEEETYIPDFSYIFKTSIKIFFMLIVIYIGYMFYKIFNESILTFANAIFWIFESIINIFRSKIKTAEYYEKNIQDKYNRIIRKTMT